MLIANSKAALMSHLYVCVVMNTLEKYPHCEKSSDKITTMQTYKTCVLKGNFFTLLNCETFFNVITFFV